MVLIYHVILQNRKIKVSCDFLRRSLSRLSYHSVKFCSHWHSGRGDVVLLVHQVILQDHVIKDQVT